jgi:hypothetical protein
MEVAFGDGVEPFGARQSPVTFVQLRELAVSDVEEEVGVEEQAKVCRPS